MTANNHPRLVLRFANGRLLFVRSEPRERPGGVLEWAGRLGPGVDVHEYGELDGLVLACTYADYAVRLIVDGEGKFETPLPARLFLPATPPVRLGPIPLGRRFWCVRLSVLN